MSHKRGLNLQNALARYLQRNGWPAAESAGAGRPGTDIAGTPGVVWENKTADAFSPLAFVRQARGHATDDEIPISVYWPRGTGEASADHTLAIMPLQFVVRLLKEAGYQ